jgi:hypothetical protein
MTCDNCRPDKNAATRRLWCPTWIGAEKGPINLCDSHAENFQPEHNYNATGGSWHWDADADIAFKQVELFVSDPNSDRFANAKGMIANGRKVGDKIYVVDGKVWLLASRHIACLGDYFVAKDIFPTLFGERK